MFKAWEDLSNVATFSAAITPPPKCCVFNIEFSVLMTLSLLLPHAFPHILAYMADMLIVK